jgi:hypothetical protein
MFLQILIFLTAFYEPHLSRILIIYQQQYLAGDKRKKVSRKEKPISSREKMRNRPDINTCFLRNLNHHAPCNLFDL